MEAKYYTPQISDIFIGFECELFYQDDFKLARTENLKWHKTIINKNKFQQAFSLIKVNKIRVKHLDREDMVSLNYNHNAEDNSYHSKLTEDEKGSFVYRIRIFDDNIINICKLYLDLSKPIELIISWIEIKNISEIKKLMIQLNIK